MTTETAPAPITPPEAPDFNNLPAVLQQNTALADRAKEAIKSTLTKVVAIDLKKLDVIEGDNIEKQVNDLRGRGTESIRMNKERRMVYTKCMDDIKSQFTASENEIKDLVDSLKDWSDKWNAEKQARIESERKANELKLAHENAKIDFARHITEQISIRFTENLAKSLERMNNKFYSLDAPGLNEYGLQLQAWTPIFTPYDYGHYPQPLLTEDEQKTVKAETEKKAFSAIQNEWIQKHVDNRDRLIELIPSRISELARIANDETAAKEAAERIKKEQEDQAAALAKEEAERKAKAEQEANAEKLNNALEDAAVAPATQLSKGTQVKLKYAPATHKEIIAMIQYWVTNHMALMTVEELTKKFSFMLTAANKDLNKGTTIEGVPTVQDFSTRTSKK